MMWKILGDVATAIVIVAITAVVCIIGWGLRIIHKHMMKD